MRYQNNSASATGHFPAYDASAWAPQDIPQNNNFVSCDWKVLCDQLRQQWQELTQRELDATGHNRTVIAKLIQRKYGISSKLAENYLRNFERTLPLFDMH